MSELTARFRVQLDGGDDYLRFLDKASAGARVLERNHISATQAISKGLRQTADDMAKLGIAAAKTALQVSGLNIGLGSQAKGILEFKHSVAELANTANLAQDKIEGLSEQILAAATASGQLKENVTEAMRAFVGKGGNIETARKNLELYAKTATATGASMEDVSQVGFSLAQHMGIKGDQRAALGILAKQGDIGSIEIKDLATQGPRIFAAAAGAKMTGIEGMRRAIGLAELFGQGVGGGGGPARVATSVEGLFRDVSKKSGQKRIGELGIEVGNRDPIEITKDIIRKLHGDDRAIQRAGIFMATSMRGVQALSRDYREHGGRFAELERFTQAGGSDEIIGNKFDFMQRNSPLVKLRQTQGAIDQAALKNMGPGVDWLTQHSDAVSSAFGWVTGHPLAALAGGAGLLAGKNILGAAMGGGGGIAGGAVGKLLGTDGMRVFVTNWPAGGLLGDGTTKGGGGWFKAITNNLPAIGTIMAATYALSEKYGGSRDMERRTGRHADGSPIEVKPTINIEISDKGVKADADGTHAPDVQLRRRVWR